MDEITQGTEEWHNIKRWNLGANDCASLLGYGFRDPWDIMAEKISGNPYQPDDPQVVARMSHGIKYEHLVRQACQDRHELHIRVPGLRRHAKYNWLTASPDGITESGCLYEFKVRQHIADKIPVKYWIQTQIQMEVWDCQQCVYCENVISEGQLSTWREWVVLRNRPWFKKYEPILHGLWQRICHERDGDGEPVARKRRRQNSTLLRIPRIVVDNLQNYLLNDKLLDWLNMYERPPQRSEPVMSRFIRAQSAQFRTLVCKALENHWGIVPIEALPSWCRLYDSQIADERPPEARRVYIGAETTRLAMEAGWPYILDACLLDDDGHGLHVDVLVSGRCLSTIVKGAELEQGYYPLIIEYHTIQMASDHCHLLNSGIQPTYKGRLWQACQILKNEGRGYVIGRKYVSVHGTERSCISMAAVVDFAGYDRAYNERCQDGLSWLQTLRDEGRHWNPQTERRLAPNMKNTNDYPWHEYKTMLADQLKDITQMYRCGQRLRRDVGHTWPQLGGMPSNIQAFIDANQTGQRQNSFPSVTADDTCAYIDFETLSNIYDSFGEFPLAEENGMIFMIGVLLHKGNDDARVFVAERMCREAESDIVHNFFLYLTDHGIRRLFHWGNAEVTALANTCKFEMFSRFEFVDLCKLFRQSMVALPGMFGYGLKDVVGACVSGPTWPVDGPQDGLEAMALAIEAYLHGKPIAESIVRYNKMDCLALKEIVKLCSAPPQ